MIVPLTIIKPLADALQSSFGGGFWSFLGLGGGGGAGATAITDASGTASGIISGISFAAAGGGTFGPGWGVVGEKGPELINVHRNGVTVVPNHISRPFLPGFAVGGSMDSSGNVSRLPFGQTNQPQQIINNYDFRGADPSMKPWIKAQIKIAQDQTLKATPGYVSKVHRDQPNLRKTG